MAAAMCSGPVSPETTSAASRISAPGRQRRCRRACAAPDDAATTLVGEVALLRAPRHERAAARVASAEGRGQLAKTFRRPSLVRPRGAGIDHDERFAPPGGSMRPACPTGERRQRKWTASAVDRQRRAAPRFLLITCDGLRPVA